MRFLRGCLLTLFAGIAAECATGCYLPAQQVKPRLSFITHDQDSAYVVILGYATPPLYEKWWNEIAACEGLPLPPEHKDVRFFAINVREYITLGHLGWSIGTSLMKDRPGTLFVKDRQIFLAFPYMKDEAIVKHEMLHQLLDMNHIKLEPRPDGDTDHPVEYYGEKYEGKCGVFPYRLETDNR